jgi:hypothetical protein
LCFDILDLNKPVDNYSKPELEIGREYVTIKGIKNTLNI